MPLILPIKFLLVGAGSLGSYASFLVAQHLKRSGLANNWVLVDPDGVEEHNLFNQLYSREDIKWRYPKVSALATRLRSLYASASSIQIYCIPKRFEEIDLKEYVGLSDMIVLSAVDNMATRRKIFEMFSSNDDVPLLIDLRGSAKQVRCYVVSRDRLSDFESTLYDDSEVKVDGCDGTISPKNAIICAAIVIEQLSNWLLGNSFNFETVMNVSGMEMVGRV